MCAAYALQAASSRPLEPQRAAPASSVAAWEQRAQGITIIRDNWGIPHVYGKTDADVVFGVIYAQAEDDFNRVETNFINSMGRLAEAEGESAISRDLRMKLFIDPVEIKAQYEKSPAWLKALMNAWADGLNYYLHTHPSVKPRVIARFEPWMALTFSEGSIGGDIEKVDLGQLEAFYGGGRQTAPAAEPGADDVDPSGSNGVAIAPANTAAGRALLLINPHTSFFFRAEAQMVSEEGLNAYGALTWGQFFIYQGFNDRTGWMHTSSSVDAVDEYAETIVKKGDAYFYRYGTEERPVKRQVISVPYRTAAGMAKKDFTVYRTHHGPIVRQSNDKWIAVRLMQEPLKALMQSYGRTKARNLKAFRESMDLHTNSSNNTIYADADGTIAYFHGELHPAAQPAVRLDAAGRRQRPGHRMERRAVGGRVTPAREPGERLALQLQQLPVVGGRREQPEEGRLPGVCRQREREPARRPRPPAVRWQEGVHARLAPCRRVRQLPPAVRDADSSAGQGLGTAAGG